MGRKLIPPVFWKKEKGLSGNVKQLVDRMLKGELSDIKVSAALVCLKHRKSPELYRKVFPVVDRFKKTNIEIKDSIEVAYPYRRKRFSPYLLIPASVVMSLLPDSSVKAVFHGDNLPYQSTKDIFDYLNISPLTVEDSYDFLKNLNLSFFSRKLFLPEISRINRVRFELNIRDVFSYIERFLNPAYSDYAVYGVSSEREIDFYLRLLDGRYKRAAAVVNTEGFPDIVSSGTVVVGSNVLDIDLSKFKAKGFVFRKLSLEEHLEFINRLLSKQLPEYENLLHINSGLLLLLVGKVKELKEGFELSKELFSKYDYRQILKNIQRYSDYLNYRNIYQL
ncbi:hypothetical protein GWK41_06405 [Persephonella atlantica]|uniref:Glycosyl transferase family 3 domain-containing protein n=1 Tax=Persephonella atlantica TaxID=2699429 RepID=A0ABS1GIF7_9AQUI|nr:hypothetical protein [Persephonella atlantica]MBK3332695.1 hypothetical protein [Persephonella atlantica]